MTDFVTDSEGKIVNIITTCEEITERKKSEEMIKHKAYYDDLTDLPNRTVFQRTSGTGHFGGKGKKQTDSRNVP